MAYFRYIDNGEGPTKLFVGGIHGNEGKTSIKFLKRLKKSDFSSGQIYIYNFDKTKYISTINQDYYDSPLGQKLLGLINELKPDFYTELHCYDIRHFENLTSMKRLDTQGVPPLIELEDYVLISSVSPLIRMDYFSIETICKTLEFPCINKLTSEIIEEYNFDFKKAFSTYENMLKIIANSPNRRHFEDLILSDYTKQAELAIMYAKYIFGENFPPY